MTALLYYSVSLGLTENEIFEIDKKVGENRKVVFEFTRNLPSNGNRKIKRICFYAIHMFEITQPLIPCVTVMTPLPPIAIYRLANMEEKKIFTSQNYPQIASVASSKVDKIRLTNEQITQLGILAPQIRNGSITTEQAILKLRGGDGLNDVVAIIAFVSFINWYDSLFGV